MIASPSLLESLNGESPDARETPLRETQEEHERAENVAADRRKPERIRDELLDEDGTAAVSDYTMWDFGSPKEAGEDLAWDHE